MKARESVLCLCVFVLCFSDSLSYNIESSSFKVHTNNVTTVHLVSSCHLDVGFADTAANIVNRYFDHFFAEAISTADELAKSGQKERLVFTTHTYLVYLYLNCPPNMGIHCPNASSVNRFLKAVSEGVIVWHAFPFNGQAEIMDETLFTFGIFLTHYLDDFVGKSQTITMSQRDVPGITRGVIPLLNKMGVKAITVGVNSASMPPAVPQAFRWVDPESGNDLLAMWHPGGYGGPHPDSLANMVVVPGMSHALAFAIRGDNSGPPSYLEVLENYEAIYKLFPNAEVVASTYDAFVVELEKFKSELPVYTEEIGDTWIYGTGSDPWKVSQFKTIMSARSDCVQSWQCNLLDERFFNFSVLLLKNAEHTWGKDVKTFLNDNTTWDNEEFHEAVQIRSNFKDMISSWVEQRDWGLAVAVDALQDHPLRREIESRIANLRFDGKMSLAGYKKMEKPYTFKLKNIVLSFDEDSGAIVQLTDTRTSSTVEWAYPQNPLGVLVYQTFVPADYETFFSEYFYTSTSYGPLDFGKPGLKDVTKYKVSAKLQALYTNTNLSSFLVYLTFDPTLVQDYGAPTKAWIQTDYDEESTSLMMTLYIVNKTSTRRPESLSLVFQPPLSDMTVNKLGTVISVMDVVQNGSQHLHGQFRGGVAVTNRDDPYSVMNVIALDTAITCIGPANPFPTPVTKPDIGSGFASNIYNNIYGTNYIMWYPYLPEDASSKYRYQMQL